MAITDFRGLQPVFNRYLGLHMSCITSMKLHILRLKNAVALSALQMDIGLRYLVRIIRKQVTRIK